MAASYSNRASSCRDLSSSSGLGMVSGLMQEGLKIQFGKAALCWYSCLIITDVKNQQPSVETPSRFCQ
jgi:hypothetical protein